MAPGCRARTSPVRPSPPAGFAYQPADSATGAVATFDGRRPKRAYGPRRACLWPRISRVEPRLQLLSRSHSVAVQRAAQGAVGERPRSPHPPRLPIQGRPHPSDRERWLAAVSMRRLFLLSGPVPDWVAPEVRPARGPVAPLRLPVGGPSTAGLCASLSGGCVLRAGPADSCAGICPRRREPRSGGAHRVCFPQDIVHLPKGWAGILPPPVRQRRWRWIWYVRRVLRRFAVPVQGQHRGRERSLSSLGAVTKQGVSAPPVALSCLYL